MSVVAGDGEGLERLPEPHVVSDHAATAPRYAEPVTKYLM